MEISLQVEFMAPESIDYTHGNYGGHGWSLPFLFAGSLRWATARRYVQSGFPFYQCRGKGIDVDVFLPQATRKDRIHKSSTANDQPSFQNTGYFLIPTRYLR